jgi:two-component system chemotaxis sensor kinase CheA
MITDLSGRGVGLDVVRATIERLHGAIQVESVSGQGLTIRLRLPVSLTATRALLVHEWGRTYALPLEEIRFVKRLRQTDVHLIEGRQCFDQEGQAIAIERLGLLLERAPPAFDEEVVLEVVVIQVGNERFGLVLERVLEITDLVVKPLMRPLNRVRHLAGLAVLSSGEVCPVLHAYDLLRSMSRTRQRAAAAPAEEVERPARKRILLAEDSITTRVQERRILEAAGYEVQTAVDGLDAWSKLALQTFDAVVSDIQMPRMSGLELAERIRRSRQYAELPIVLVTSLASESDRRRGLEVGADAYITKSEFDQGLLLDCLARLA